MVRPGSSKDTYVTFRGVSAAVVTSNYQHYSTHVVRTRTHARITVPGECYVGASRILWTVDQSNGYTYWTLDSGHLSLSSPTIPTALRSTGCHRWGGGGRRWREDRTLPVTRADVYALSERTPRLYILYKRALREEGGRYIVRHVMYIRGINKAPYCVNYDRAACRHS